MKNLTPYSEFNAYYLVTECNVANPGIVIESTRYGNCSYERFLSGFAVSISVTNSTQVDRIPMDVIAIMIFK